MAKRRNPRIDGQVRDAIADLIETETADPRLSFVTITDVSVTPDHKHATVLYSTLDPALVARDPRRSGGDRLADPSEVAAGLDAAAPRLQGLLARRMRLRNTPVLTFKPDPVVEQADRIESLLRQVREQEGEREAGSSGLDGPDGRDA